MCINFLQKVNVLSKLNIYTSNIFVTPALKSCTERKGLICFSEVHFYYAVECIHTTVKEDGIAKQTISIHAAAHAHTQTHTVVYQTT